MSDLFILGANSTTETLLKCRTGLDDPLKKENWVCDNSALCPYTHFQCFHPQVTLHTCVAPDVNSQGPTAGEFLATIWADFLLFSCVCLNRKKMVDVKYKDFGKDD